MNTTTDTLFKKAPTSQSIIAIENPNIREGIYNTLELEYSLTKDSFEEAERALKHRALCHSTELERADRLRDKMARLERLSVLFSFKSSNVYMTLSDAQELRELLKPENK